MYFSERCILLLEAPPQSSKAPVFEKLLGSSGLRFQGVRSLRSRGLGAWNPVSDLSTLGMMDLLALGCAFMIWMLGLVFRTRSYTLNLKPLEDSNTP